MTKTAVNSDKQFDAWWSELDGWGFRCERCIAAFDKYLQDRRDRREFNDELYWWIKAAFEAGFEAALQTSQPVVLDDASFDAFNEVMENPPPPNEKLRALLK